MSDRNDFALNKHLQQAKIRAEWTLGTDWVEIAMRHIEAARAEGFREGLEKAAGVAETMVSEYNLTFEADTASSVANDIERRIRALAPKKDAEP